MIEGQHFQNAYVTRNAEKALAAVSARATGRQPAFIDAPSEVMTATGRGLNHLKIGFVWVGDVQYEFIEPVSEAVPPMYTGFLPDGDGLRFHHSCARVGDWDDFRRPVDEQPLPVVIEGESDGLRYLFLDARDLVGHYLEYIWMTDEHWTRSGGR